MNFVSWGSVHLPAESTAFQRDSLSSRRVYGTALPPRQLCWEWWAQHWEAREDAVATTSLTTHHFFLFFFPNFGESLQEGMKTFKIWSAHYFQRSWSFFSFSCHDVSAKKAVLQSPLSHRVINWTCDFSYHLDLGSDSHWTLDPKMAVDSLTPNSCTLFAIFCQELLSGVHADPFFYHNKPLQFHQFSKYKHQGCLDELVPCLFFEFGVPLPPPAPYLALFCFLARSSTTLEPVMPEPVPGEELVV